MSLRDKNKSRYKKKYIHKIVGVIDGFIPKDKKIVVFSGNSLRGINGNVAAVIHAWPDNPGVKNFEGYVLSRKNEHFNGLKTINPCSVTGLYILLKAYTIILTHGPVDLYWKTLAYNRNRRIINLWHGIPLKKIQPRKIWNNTVLIASSMIDRLALSVSFKLALEKIFVTGLPRTDQIINHQKELKQDALKRLNIGDEGQKWILYAPTFRKYINSKAYLHELPDFLHNELEKLLVENNAYFIFRYHINQPISNFSRSERFIPAHFDIFPDIEPLYALADILITDYSSCIFEYLFLNRPIIGLAPDLEEYSTTTGFLFDYKSIFPGPIAPTWSELRNFIIGAIKDPLTGSFLREDRLKLFNQYLDGSSAVRCINIICDLNIR